MSEGYAEPQPGMAGAAIDARFGSLSLQAMTLTVENVERGHPDVLRGWIWDARRLRQLWRALTRTIGRPSGTDPVQIRYRSGAGTMVVRRQRSREGPGDPMRRHVAKTALRALVAGRFFVRVAF
jgi:hypothetical protein